MNVHISPLSALSGDLLIEYLKGRGKSEATTRWKYLDARFNRGRERGFAALRDGAIIGFIGLLPVTLRKGEESREYNWMYDWSIADVVGDKGVGGRLLRAALEHNGNVLGRGGTRLARIAFTDKVHGFDLEACLVFAKALTPAAYLSGLRARGYYPAPLPLSLFDWLSPVRWRKRRDEFAWREGVHPALPGLMASEARAGWRPEFDLADLRWQIEDCPDVRGWTCIGEADGVAVLAWTSARTPAIWKLVLVGTRQAALRACIGEALRNIVGLGGASASVMVSRVDADLVETLGASGFRPSGRPWRIGIFNARAEGAPAVLERLSFLDSDEAHRF